MSNPGRSASFLGRRMLVLAIVTSVMTGPGQTIGVSVFIDHLVAALDSSRSVVSTAYLIGTLTGAAALPFVGRFVDRRGVRTAQLVVGVAFAVALVFMAGVNGVVWLTVGFAGIRMFGQGSLSMISSVTVALWFERRRGLAMGILATAAGALMTMVPVVLNAVIEATSWRIAWLVAAGVVAATVLPIAQFGLVDRPADVGQRPDGDPWGEPEINRPVEERLPPRSRAAVSPPPQRPLSGHTRVAASLPPQPLPGHTRVAASLQPQPPLLGYTRAEATRTSQFWILAMIGSVSGMLITGLNFHQIDLLGDAGLSSGEAAAMFLPQILGSSTTALGIGYALDRIGTRFVPAISMAMLVLVHVLAANLDGGVMILVYAVALGAVGGTVRAALSTMIPGYFGTAHIGSIQGVLNVAMVGGSALGPVALAVAEAAFGGYRNANLWLMIIPIVTTVVALTNRPMRPRPLAESGTMEVCVAT